jgi:hypothetical protein
MHYAELHTIEKEDEDKAADGGGRKKLHGC